jgi:hypothetical protein
MAAHPSLYEERTAACVETVRLTSRPVRFIAKSGTSMLPTVWRILGTMVCCLVFVLMLWLSVA